MADSSSIEWTEATWNPLTGCTKISPGCKFCYAERLAKRLQAMGSARYANGFALTLHADALEIPQRWRAPRKIFVNSMSDLFHAKVPTAFIAQVFAAMNAAPQHQYQVLTKRSDRLASLSPELPWSRSIWMGVSVESERWQRRVDDLRRTTAFTKFLSLEPLLGPLPRLDLSGIDWVIVGGESGPKARPMDHGWATEIRDQCVAAGVPFFFKQWGGKNKKRTGRVLEGRTWDQFPATQSLAAA
jgi:protein gp37